MSSGFNIQDNNVDLKAINKYLLQQGVNLSEQESAQLNSIFDESDTYDDKNQQEGKDGVLKGAELTAFWHKVSDALPSIKNHIDNFLANLNKQKTKNSIEESFVQKPDALYVAKNDKEYVKNNMPQEAKVPSEVKEDNPPKLIDKTSDIRTDYDWSEEKFNSVLSEMLDAPKYQGKFKNSVLRGQGKAFIEAGKKYKVDPRVLVSIAMCESERGISRKARELNNVGGLIINGKYHHFESVAASIDSIAKTVNTRYDEGYTTLNSIGHSGKYCAKSAAQSWIRDGMFYMKCFDKYYNQEN